MRVAVEAIPDSGQDVTVGLADAWAAAAASDALDAPASALEGALHLERRGATVVVTGNLAASAPATCARCGAAFVATPAVSVDLAYAPEPEEADANERELAADELDLGFYRGGAIDLADVISEALALEVPDRPTCPDVSACDARTAELLGAQQSMAGHPAFAALRHLTN